MEDSTRRMESPPMRRVVPTLLLAAAVLAPLGFAAAQHGQQKGQIQKETASPVDEGTPFDFKVFGAFRDMMQKKDHGPKVGLDAIMAHGTTDAVGALSDLRGEVTLIGGRPVITYGVPCSSCPPTQSEKATLLAAARVSVWTAPIALPADLAGHALDRYIIEQANKAGLDMMKPFPVRLKGTLTNVAMHVIRASNPLFGGHGTGEPMALQEDIKAGSVEGEVVGFYAPEALLGIVTHPGEPFHYHWLDTGRTRTAHLDAFGMAKGAQLLLPKQ